MLARVQKKCEEEVSLAELLDDEFSGGAAAAGLDEPASLKAELWSDEDSSGQEPEDEEFGALHAAGAGAKGAQGSCQRPLYVLSWCFLAACRLGHAHALVSRTAATLHSNASLRQAMSV